MRFGGYCPAAPDDKLTPADPQGLAGLDRFRAAPPERSGFVVMKKPPAIGAGRIGSGFERKEWRRRCGPDRRALCAKPPGLLATLRQLRVPESRRGGRGAYAFYVRPDMTFVDVKFRLRPAPCRRLGKPRAKAAAASLGRQAGAIDGNDRM